MAGHVRQEAADRSHRFGVGVDEVVDQPCLLGMQPPAAELFEVDLLTGRHRNQPRAGNRHDGTLLHHGEIGAAALPSGRAERSIERCRNPRRVAHAAELADVVTEHRTHALGAHRVRQSGPGRLADMHERHAAFGTCPPDVAHLFRVGRASRRAFGGEIVGDHAYVAALDASEAGELAVARSRIDIRLVHARSAEQADFEEAAGIEQGSQSLLAIELAAFFARRQFFGPAHGAGRCPPALEFRDEAVVGHFFLSVSRLAFEHQRLDGEALDRCTVEGRPVVLRQVNRAVLERQFWLQQTVFGLQEAVELAGVADRGARGASFEPAMNFTAEPVAQHGIHAVALDSFQSLVKSLKTAEPLELELAEADSLDPRCAIDVVEGADRLVQHQRHGRYVCHGGVGVPVVTVARLFKQLDAGRIKRPRELLALLARIGTVGIEPQRGAAGDRALDDRNALEIASTSLPTLILNVRNPIASQSSTSSQSRWDRAR